MYKTYLTCGAILVMMSLYRTADGLRWRDGQKWRQRRIAHVFGKRNQERNMAHVFGKRNEDGISSILQLPIEPVHSAPGPVLNDDSVDYDDGSFLTETEDRVPQSILNRLRLLDILRQFKPRNDELVDNWDDVKSYLDYSEH